MKNFGQVAEAINKMTLNKTSKKSSPVSDSSLKSKINMFNTKSKKSPVPKLKSPLEPLTKQNSTEASSFLLQINKNPQKISIIDNKNQIFPKNPNFSTQEAY